MCHCSVLTAYINWRPCSFCTLNTNRNTHAIWSLLNWCKCGRYTYYQEGALVLSLHLDRSKPNSTQFITFGGELLIGQYSSSADQRGTTQEVNIQGLCSQTGERNSKISTNSPTFRSRGHYFFEKKTPSNGTCFKLASASKSYTILCDFEAVVSCPESKPVPDLIYMYLIVLVPRATADTISASCRPQLRRLT
jgi:hypothetical protein